MAENCVCMCVCVCMCNRIFGSRTMAENCVCVYVFIALAMETPKNYRSLLQNIVSCIGLICKRDL